MSRKDYIEVADIIRVQNDLATTDPERGQLTRIARDLAGFFARDNGRFDRQKFLSACGITN